MQKARHGRHQRDPASALVCNQTEDDHQRGGLAWRYRARDSCFCTMGGRMGSDFRNTERPTTSTGERRAQEDQSREACTCAERAAPWAWAKVVGVVLLTLVGLAIEMAGQTCGAGTMVAPVHGRTAVEGGDSCRSGMAPAEYFRRPAWDAVAAGGQAGSGSAPIMPGQPIAAKLRRPPHAPGLVRRGVAYLVGNLEAGKSATTWSKAGACNEHQGAHFCTRWRYIRQRRRAHPEQTSGDAGAKLFEELPHARDFLTPGVVSESVSARSRRAAPGRELAARSSGGAEGDDAAAGVGNISADRDGDAPGPAGVTLLNSPGRFWAWLLAAPEKDMHARGARRSRRVPRQHLRRPEAQTPHPLQARAPLSKMFHPAQRRNKVMSNVARNSTDTLSEPAAEGERTRFALTADEGGGGPTALRVFIFAPGPGFRACAVSVV
eukprot:g3518.t1